MKYVIPTVQEYERGKYNIFSDIGIKYVNKKKNQYPLSRQKGVRPFKNGITLYMFICSFQFLFQQLGLIIAIVKQHIKKYLDDIFSLIKVWSTELLSVTFNPKSE